MKYSKIALALLLMASLASCNRAAKQNARDMAHSKADYKMCLEDHPQKPSACDTAKRIYDADVKAYEVTASKGRSKISYDDER